jgi:hypothetical protein
VRRGSLFKRWKVRRVPSTPPWEGNNPTSKNQVDGYPEFRDALVVLAANVDINPHDPRGWAQRSEYTLRGVSLSSFRRDTIYLPRSPCNHGEKVGHAASDAQVHIVRHSAVATIAQGQSSHERVGNGLFVQYTDYVVQGAVQLLETGMCSILTQLLALGGGISITRLRP